LKGEALEVPRLSHTTRHKFPHPCHPKLPSLPENPIPRSFSGVAKAPPGLTESKDMVRHFQRICILPSFLSVGKLLQLHKRLIPGLCYRDVLVGAIISNYWVWESGRAHLQSLVGAMPRGPRHIFFELLPAGLPCGLPTCSAVPILLVDVRFDGERRIVDLAWRVVTVCSGILLEPFNWIPESVLQDQLGRRLVSGESRASLKICAGTSRGLTSSQAKLPCVGLCRRGFLIDGQGSRLGVICCRKKKI
jgi:hypothetical protein